LVHQWAQAFMGDHRTLAAACTRSGERAGAKSSIEIFK